MNHLPECPMSNGVVCQHFPELCLCQCQCKMLRACEARVKRDEEAWWRKYVRIQQSDSYKAGLLAAREAVAALYDEVLGFPPRATVLAAIDGLVKP